MNILIYVDVFCGPTMTFLYRQVKSLSQSNNVTVVCRKINNEHLYPYSDVIVLPRSVLDRIKRFLKRKTGTGFNVLNPNFDKEVEEIIADNNIDVVLSHFGPNGVEINMVVSRLNIPHYTIIHGYDGSSLLKEKGYVRDLKAAKGIKYIFASRSMKSNFKSMAGIDSGEVIPLGISMPSEVAVATKKFNYFFQAANFVEKKGHIYTLKAFRKFLNFNRDFELVFAGDGPERKRLEAFVKTNGLEGHVHFLGHCDQATVKKHLAECTALVHHSITAVNGDQESIPTGIMEAMASGTVVLSTNHSGIPEIITHGVSGFLVDEKDIDAYVDCMKIVSESDTSDISNSAYKQISVNYNFDNQLDRIMLMLRKPYEN